MYGLVPRSDGSLFRLRSFDLRFAFDDEADPTSVTVFDPTDDRVATRCVTVDVDTAVDVAHVA